MSFRFYRRLKIAPGLSVNFQLRADLSVGVRGTLTVGRRGVTKTVGLPGRTVLHVAHGLHSGYHSAASFRRRRPRNKSRRMA
jgi:hypothetical protein